MALARARKPYRVGILSTHMNGDFGSISVTERSCHAPISKVERHISDRFCATVWCKVTAIRTVAEVNKQEREMKLAVPEVNTQEWGLGFSSPNPLDQTAPAWCSMCVNNLFHQFYAVAVHTRHELITIWYSVNTASIMSDVVLLCHRIDWSSVI